MEDVLAWLLEAGIEVSKSDNYDEFKGAIQVEIPMSVAEDLREFCPLALVNPAFPRFHAATLLEQSV